MRKPETLNSKVVEILTNRFYNEYKHHYMYRAASNWCKGVGYNLAADYFAKESESELGHALKIQELLVDWNVIPDVSINESPKLEFKNLYELIVHIYDDEYRVYEEYEEDSMQLFRLGELQIFDFFAEYRKLQKDGVAEYSDMINMLEGTNVDSKFEMLVLEEKLFE